MSSSRKSESVAVANGDWVKSKFSEVCTITRGSSPRPIISWVSDEGTPWVKISDATGEPGRYISKTKEFIRNEGRTKSVVVHPGDLVVSNSATPGLPKFLKIEACIHDGWLLLRNFKNVVPEYLYYVVENDRKELVGKGSGSIFTNLKTEILKNHEISLPSVREQERIAKILGEIDDKLALNFQMSRTLESLAQTIFTSWFIDFDPTKAKLAGEMPKGVDAETALLFPDSMEDSELGLIPKGWKVEKFGEANDLLMGQSPPGDTYNSEGDGLPFYQGRTDFGFRFPKQRIFCTQENRVASPGETLISVRAPVGDLNQAIEKCIIGRGVASALHKSKSATYTYSLLKSLYPKLSYYNGEGTVFGAINRSDFNNLLIVEPSQSLIESFETVCGPINDMIRSLFLSTLALTKLRTSLLPRLLSGELRIPEEKLV